MAQATHDFQKLQLDLFENLEIDSILYHDKQISYSRDGNAFYIYFPDSVRQYQLVSFEIFYHGIPIVAIRPPWDGGFVWAKDSLWRDWVGITCEGTGASVWWPNKDHLSDEPDSLRITIEAPENLDAISNGQLESISESENHFRRWTWKVNYPINNYNVTINLGHYAYIKDMYVNGVDTTMLKYYMLDYNSTKAIEQFKQVKQILACYDHYFGDFPFKNDGYKLVESPYWGMEHQTAIAYGNEYENNTYGFDFILVHESAHEWWGNSISVNDHAELWIHEAFATYMEALYVEYFQGYEKSLKYLADQKELIKNQKPIIGTLNVNYNDWDDADMYYKGSWMLHSIRNTINNDSLWFHILKNTYQHFKYQNLGTTELTDFIQSQTEYDLQPIYDQYLRTIQIPVLAVNYKAKRNGIQLKYKWENANAEFNMPTRVKCGEKDWLTIYPGTKKKKIVLNCAKSVDIDFATDSFLHEVKK